ncbi:MAG TPA: hypothetical protein DDZ88_27535 [Verrucomicrobiales bacterium]|nr:hypothetical protein [Verrucomicrobiales bacterium]
MKPAQLYQYNGAAVEISLNEAKALGILFLSDKDEACVLSLRYLTPQAPCPLVQHVLSEEEIKGLAKKNRHQLLSRIQISAKAPGTGARK